MNMAVDLSHIKQAIQVNDLKGAIDALLAFTHEQRSRFHNEVILHAGSLNQWLEDKRAGLLSSDEARREQSRIRHALLGLIDVIEEASKTPAPRTVSHVPGSQWEIFISYSWAVSNIADDIDTAFKLRGITLSRDVRDAPYKADIGAFMQRLGQSSYVILVISDSYLKSRNCMYEALELLKNEDFNDRIFPIVLPDAAKIYDAVASVEYLNYWNHKIEELNETLKSLPSMGHAGRVYEEINQSERIRSAIDDFIYRIQNMNTLTIEKHRAENYQSIFDAIGIAS